LGGLVLSDAAHFLYTLTSLLTPSPLHHFLYPQLSNAQVKNIGICVFNSNWIKTCFGKPALDALRKEAVICSGSTLGAYCVVLCVLWLV